MGADILSIFCPSCAAPAEFDIVNQNYRCQSCGGTVELEAARQEKIQYRNKVQQKVNEGTYRFPLMTTSCSGCGATLVFEENEAVSSCDFCGRKLVRQKYIRTKDVPEAIIPFAVTMEEAKEKLQQWCEKNRRRKEAKHLQAKLNDIRGYYLPYQMARGPVSCAVNKLKEPETFAARGYLQDEFVNCSSQLDNLVLDAMEPYDLADLKEFDYAYVAGHRVKITDISGKETKERLQKEVDSNYRVFMEKIWGTKAIQLDTKVETVVQSPVLLPVYYIKEGEVSAAINGQTGKVSVRAEKDSMYISLPWWLEAIVLFVAACAMVFGISWLSTGNTGDSLLITGVLAMFYIFVFCFAFEPGLNNTGSITYYRNIFTSGEQSFRREKGRLIPRDEVLKRKLTEPVFLKSFHGKDTPVTYVFRSKIRILSMIVLGMVAVFLPVIIALLINGFNFSQIALGGSAVWFCITVPTVPILMIQLGLKELYSNPWVYTIDESGKKKRFHWTEKKDWLGVLMFLLLHPVGWIILGSLAIMVYLTAFGF